MVLAFSFFVDWSGSLTILLCAVVLLFLIKSINIKDRLWLASVCSVSIVALIALYQIIAQNNLLEQLREKEAKIASLQSEYDRMKIETQRAQSTFDGAGAAVRTSRNELDELQRKVNAEFDRTVGEIRRIYADISDEDLSRRFNDAVRTSRRNLKTNVFQ